MITHRVTLTRRHLIGHLHISALRDKLRSYK